MVALHTETKKRLPDRCPRHPASGIVITSVSNDNEIHLQRILTQHRCGENNCNEGLGWHYNGPHGAFRSGTGSCQDQTIHHAIAHEKHRDLAATIYVMLVIIATLAYAAICLLLTHTQDRLWSWNHTTATLLFTPCVAGIYIATRHALRRREPLPPPKTGEHEL